MFKYTIRRVLQSIPILLIVLTLVFVVVRVLPGDPAVAALGDYASEASVQALREKLGLNDPIWLQYVKFLGNLVSGDLGISAITGYPVAKQVVRVLPYTLELTFCAILLGYIVGVPLGISAAVHRNSFIDYFTDFFTAGSFCACILPRDYPHSGILHHLSHLSGGRGWRFLGPEG